MTIVFTYYYCYPFVSLCLPGCWANKTILAFIVAWLALSQSDGLFLVVLRFLASGIAWHRIIINIQLVLLERIIISLGKQNCVVLTIQQKYTHAHTWFSCVIILLTLSLSLILWVFILDALALSFSLCIFLSLLTWLTTCLDWLLLLQLLEFKFNEWIELFCSSAYYYYYYYDYHYHFVPFSSWPARVWSNLIVVW